MTDDHTPATAAHGRLSRWCLLDDTPKHRAGRFGRIGLRSRDPAEGGLGADSRSRTAGHAGPARPQSGAHRTCAATPRPHDRGRVGAAVVDGGAAARRRRHPLRRDGRARRSVVDARSLLRVHCMGPGDARRAARARTVPAFHPGDDRVQLRGDRRVDRVAHGGHRDRHRRDAGVDRVRRRAVCGVRGARHRPRAARHLRRCRPQADPPVRGLGHRRLDRDRGRGPLQLRLQPGDRRRQRRRAQPRTDRGRRRARGR